MRLLNWIASATDSLPKTVHLTELEDWRPSSSNLPETIAACMSLYSLIGREWAQCTTFTIPLTQSQRLECTFDLSELEVNEDEPPSVYLLDDSLEFPCSAEAYYRVIKTIAAPNRTNRTNRTNDPLILIGRSSREYHELSENSRFHNCLYVTNRFLGCMP